VLEKVSLVLKFQVGIFPLTKPASFLPPLLHLLLFSSRSLKRYTTIMIWTRSILSLLVAANSNGNSAGRTTARTPKQTLQKWLEERSGRPLPSVISVDETGLRGLRWAKTSTDSAGEIEIACEIPLDCILVADSHRELLEELLEQSRRGPSESKFQPFLDSLPLAEDLVGLGSQWEDYQLERLAHEPTIQKLKAIRDKRNKVVKDNDTQLAWAYDIVTTRAITGPFGHQGGIRNTVAALMVSVIIAVLPTVANPDSLSLLFLVPLLLSFVSLLSYTRRKPQVALVPWVDLANHQSGNNQMMFEYNLFSESILWKQKQGPIRCGGVMDVDPWITFEYLDQATNDDLLGLYGFVEHDNPNDTMQLFCLEDKGDRLITVGRKGHCQQDVSPKVLVASAQQTRERLAAPAAAPVKDDDSVDIARATLAENWRREKIRLLDEVLPAYVKS
jgi:hypothetical protein